MTVDEALAYADEWAKGQTFYEGMQGWRVVCAVLAAEVRRLRAESGEPVKFLANGTRFKMSFFDGEVGCFGGFENQLEQKWVALVEATNDIHLKYTAPQRVPPEIIEQVRAIETPYYMPETPGEVAFRDAIEQVLQILRGAE